MKTHFTEKELSDLIAGAKIVAAKTSGEDFIAEVQKAMDSKKPLIEARPNAKTK